MAQVCERLFSAMSDANLRGISRRSLSVMAKCKKQTPERPCFQCNKLQTEAGSVYSSTQESLHFLLGCVLVAAESANLHE